MACAPSLGSRSLRPPRAGEAALQERLKPERWSLRPALPSRLLIRRLGRRSASPPVRSPPPAPRRWPIPTPIRPKPRPSPPRPAPAALPLAPPRVALVLTALLLPIVFIFAASISELVASPVSRVRHVLGFFGHPFTALIVAALFVMIVLGIRRGSSREQITKITTDALAPTATLLLIMGGGGAFKQVIVDSGVGAYAGEVLAHSHISPLLVAYIIAASLRIAQGSATVAIITAAGILAPIVKGIPGYKPEILVLAVGAGGTILSHVNDAGFWLVKEYFGLTVPDTLRSWSAMKVIISLVGFGCVLLIQFAFG